MRTRDFSIINKLFLISLLILDVLFLVYWVLLAVYSQPHYDDLFFLWKTRDISVFNYVKEMYFARSGRFVAYFINGIVSFVTLKTGFHQFWAIIYYILGIGLCWAVVKDYFLTISKKTRFLVLCLLYNLYILTSLDFPVFYWLCAMSYYLLLPAMCLFIKYLLKDSLRWYQWLIFGLLVIFLGGGNEAFTPIVLLVMFIIALHFFKNNKWIIKNTWNLPQVKKIVFSAVLLSFLLLIVVVAPGNYVRMSDVSLFSHPSGVVGWAKAYFEACGMFVYFSTFYIPYYTVVFSMAFYLGGKSQLQLPYSKTKTILLIIICFALYLVISTTPNVYLYNGFGLQRLYIPTVAVLLIMVFSCGYVLGIGKSSLFAKTYSLFGIIALSIIMGINVITDIPSAKKYCDAVNERVELLCQLRDSGQKETIIVQPLPKPYTEDAKHLILKTFGKETPKSTLYYLSETSQIPTEYVWHMKKLYHLDFDFVLAKEENNGKRHD